MCHNIIYLILEPAEFTLIVQEMFTNAINITWSSKTSAETSEYSFLLTINSSSISSPMTLVLHNTLYLFTASEHVPPCEVYNFSVTATHVGATYTGAGCSVSSPVLSTMLLSVPDIDKMEQTIQFTLAKLSGELIFNISYEVSTKNLLTYVLGNNFFIPYNE